MDTFLTNNILRNIPSSERFDQKALLNYLRANVEIFPAKSPVKILKFGYGQSNPAYLLKCDGLQFVLKKQPYGSLAKAAHSIDREYRVMSALQNSLVPVPKMYHLCTDASIIGTPFYLCEFVKGRIFTQSHLPSLKPQQRFTIYAEAQRVLSEIHSIDLHKVGLSDFSKSKTEHIQRLVNISNAQFLKNKTAETENIFEFAEIHRKINAYKRKDTSQNIISLVHGDYKYDNIVFDPKTFRIIAVLDWELSSIGNPLIDVAQFCRIYDQPKSKTSSSGLKGINLNKYGIPHKLQFVRGWIQGLNINSSTFIKNFQFPIKDFNFYMALTVYRALGIIGGIFNRIKSGNASNPTAFLPKSVSSNVLLKLMASDGLSYFNGKHKGLYSRLLTIPRAVVLRKKPEHLQIYLEPFRKHFENSNFFELRRKLLYFMEAYVYPFEKQQQIFYSKPANSLKNWPGLEILKSKAKELRLWNLCDGLTQLQYAPLCEIMGRAPFIAPKACNCQESDWTNMRILEKYGNKMQKERWLTPLRQGKIQSCLCRTENTFTKTADGKYYVINGRQHFVKGECEVFIVMGKINSTTENSMLIVPTSLKGIKIVRQLKVFGYSDISAPFGHCEIVFDHVYVPCENLIYGEGKGCIDGIHYCMKMIGMCERSLDLMKKRCLMRYAFGSMIAEKISIQQNISDSRCEIEQVRLLVLQTAAMMESGNTRVRQYISMVKVVTPRMALKVIDRAIQLFGGAGVSQDCILPKLYALCRCIDAADGPSKLHQRVVSRIELQNSKL